DQDLHRLLDVNLRGAIQLTQTLLPVFNQLKRGTLVHIGGFADGRLAFPFYTVDVATRAGLRSFIEALNRELNHPDIVISYFCPAVADTEAERPYHDLWREMGVAIVPSEQVARALLNAIHRKRRVTIMGTATRLFAALNAVAPALADRVLMRHYSTILRRHFEST
ncbi:MAG TPA: SDR family NAD(P)-dependent oxidoreductase, partial [Phototrophicaceae bacterium]|nr:SDR family NAD(P)-dependent oxidoreductase [Phototrophicaceae bacterium]